jgi:hypothetical protein
MPQITREDAKNILRVLEDYDEHPAIQKRLRLILNPPRKRTITFEMNQRNTRITVSGRNFTEEELLCATEKWLGRREITGWVQDKSIFANQHGEPAVSFVPRSLAPAAEMKTLKDMTPEEVKAALASMGINV